LCHLSCIPPTTESPVVTKPETTGISSHLDIIINT
jgi:hypothetical protein